LAVVALVQLVALGRAQAGQQVRLAHYFPLAVEVVVLAVVRRLKAMGQVLAVVVAGIVPVAALAAAQVVVGTKAMVAAEEEVPQQVVVVVVAQMAVGQERITTEETQAQLVEQILAVVAVEHGLVMPLTILAVLG